MAFLNGHKDFEKKKSYQFFYVFTEPRELPQVSFNNEELNSPNRSAERTPRKVRSKKRRSTNTTTSTKKPSKVMTKVMAVRQQQKQSPATTGAGLDPASSGQSSSSNGSQSKWDMSARALLSMTQTFLRHVPEVSSKDRKTS